MLLLRLVHTRYIFKRQLWRQFAVCASSVHTRRYSRKRTGCKNLESQSAIFLEFSLNFLGFFLVLMLIKIAVFPGN